MNDFERTASVIGQVVSAATNIDDPSLVAKALAASVIEMRALVNGMRDDHRGFIQTLAALAAQNGGRLEIDKLTFLDLDPRDAIERHQDVRTGNIIYTLVRFRA